MNEHANRFKSMAERHGIGDTMDPAHQLIMDKEALKGLSPQEERAYRQRVIHRYIRENGENGVSRSELEDSLGMSRKTIDKYTEMLRTQRKIYMVNRSGTKYFYPNGIDNHPLLDEAVPTENGRLSFKLLEHEDGHKEVFIQEKEKNDEGLWEDVGGITIHTSDLGRVMAALDKIHGQLDEEITEVEPP